MGFVSQLKESSESQLIGLPIVVIQCHFFKLKLGGCFKSIMHVRLSLSKPFLQAVCIHFDELNVT